MTAGERIRVLVVDDSAFARKVIREALAADDRIDVVGHANDGLDALEKIQELSPDVVTMDLMMPELDGVEVLRALGQFPSPPPVVVVTTEGDDTAAAIAALQEGAFDVIVKPTRQATDRLYSVGRAVLEKVLVAARSEKRPGPPPAAPAPRIMRPGRTELVVIGASTGGPRAVTLLLQALPADLEVPVAIVVHMPEGFTAGFAERLDRGSALQVFESRSGPLRPGQVAIATAGVHLRVKRSADGCELVHDLLPSDTLHRPSVDVLFTSAAEAYGEGVLGVVLTGMGQDGLEGARALRARGARMLAQDEATSVVYGMPRAIVDDGLADLVLPLGGIADAIVRGVRAPARV